MGGRGPPTLVGACRCPGVGPCDERGVPHRGGTRPGGDRPPARRVRLGGAGPQGPEPVRRAGGGRPGVHHGAGHGRADYLLFVDGKAVGAVEAKPSGTPLAGVEPQSAKYAAGLPKDLPAIVSPLPFLYESTGDETMFTDGFDPEPRSRPVVTFHRPETLARWLRHWIDDADGGSLRARLRPAWPGTRRTGCGGSRSRRSVGSRRRCAGTTRVRWPRWRPGPGKTFMAANLAYRLVQTAGAERVLFLVDRANLGPADAAGVPAVRHPRRRPQVHRPLQRPAAHLEPDRPGRAGGDHDGAAPLLDAARRGGAARGRRREVRRRDRARAARRGRVQPDRSRSRRSTW